MVCGKRKEQSWATLQRCKMDLDGRWSHSNGTTLGYITLLEQAVSIFAPNSSPVSGNRSRQIPTTLRQYELTVGSIEMLKASTRD